MGNHWHINNGMHRLPHIWPFIFTPYISPKPPFFTKNCHPKSYFLERPCSAGIWEKVPKCPYFHGFCHWKTPYFVPCIHMFVWGEMLLPQTQSEAGKFCILRTESCNLVYTCRCKINKGAENKISVLQAQLTQLCIMDEFHWRAGMIHRPLSLWSNTEGDISYNHPL